VGKVNYYIVDVFSIGKYTGNQSLLFLKANEDNEKINVFVGGKVTKIAQGEWLKY